MTRIVPRDSVVASHLSLPKHLRKESLIDEEGLDNKQERGLKPLLSVLEEMFSFSLLLNPSFLLIVMSNLLGLLGFFVPYVFLPNMAIMRGIHIDSANFLLSIIGISNTLGRLVSGE